MRISYNVAAYLANDHLEANNSKLEESIERLSSGLRINSAKDDPSGMAIAKKMNAQIQGLEKATLNAQNGISVVETAEGALSEVQAMLQRMNELAIQGANGTLGTTQRQYVQDEVDALCAEITRIASDTAFNGMGLLDGSMDLNAYCDDTSIACTYYSDDVRIQEYGITINSITQDADGEITEVDVTLGATFPDDALTTWDDGQLIITASDGFEMKIAIDENSTTGTEITIDATGIGALKVQIGANEGQVLEIRIPEVSLEHLGIDDLSLLTQEDSSLSIEKITDAIESISAARSRLGAYQNRLEYSISSTETTGINMTSAHSRIMDLDMADEMTEYTTYEVLTQASTTILAQANERPQQVLQLLQ